MTPRKPLHKSLKRHEAEHESSTAKSWQCATCDKFIEHHMTGIYCNACQSYWNDVRDGFDDAEPFL